MKKVHVAVALLGLACLPVSGCGTPGDVPEASPTIELTSFAEVWGVVKEACLGTEEPQPIRLNAELNAQMVECWADDENLSTLTIVVADGAKGFEEAALDRLGSFGAEAAMGDNWVVAQHPGKVAQATYELHHKTGEEKVQAIADGLNGWLHVDPEREAMYELAPGEQAVGVLMDALHD